MSGGPRGPPRGPARPTTAIATGSSPSPSASAILSQLGSPLSLPPHLATPRPATPHPATPHPATPHPATPHPATPLSASAILSQLGSPLGLPSRPPTAIVSGFPPLPTKTGSAPSPSPSPSPPSKAIMSSSPSVPTTPNPSTPSASSSSVSVPVSSSVSVPVSKPPSVGPFITNGDAIKHVLSEPRAYPLVKILNATPTAITVKNELVAIKKDIESNSGKIALVYIEPFSSIPKDERYKEPNGVGSISAVKQGATVDPSAGVGSATPRTTDPSAGVGSATPRTTDPSAGVGSKSVEPANSPKRVGTAIEVGSSASANSSNSESQLGLEKEPVLEIDESKADGALKTVKDEFVTLLLSLKRSCYNELTTIAPPTSSVASSPSPSSSSSPSASLIFSQELSITILERLLFFVTKSIPYNVDHSYKSMFTQIFQRFYNSVASSGRINHVVIPLRKLFGIDPPTNEELVFLDVLSQYDVTKKEKDHPIDKLFEKKFDPLHGVMWQKALKKIIGDYTISDKKQTLIDHIGSRLSGESIIFDFNTRSGTPYIYLYDAKRNEVAHISVMNDTSTAPYTVHITVPVIDLTTGKQVTDSVSGKAKSLHYYMLIPANIGTTETFNVNYRIADPKASAPTATSAKPPYIFRGYGSQIQSQTAKRFHTKQIYTSPIFTESTIILPLIPKTIIKANSEALLYHEQVIIGELFKSINLMNITPTIEAVLKTKLELHTNITKALDTRQGNFNMAITNFKGWIKDVSSDIILLNKNARNKLIDCLKYIVTYLSFDIEIEDKILAFLKLVKVSKAIEKLDSLRDVAKEKPILLTEINAIFDSFIIHPTKKGGKVSKTRRRRIRRTIKYRR